MKRYKVRSVGRCGSNYLVHMIEQNLGIKPIDNYLRDKHEPISYEDALEQGKNKSFVTFVTIKHPYSYFVSSREAGGHHTETIEDDVEFWNKMINPLIKGSFKYPEHYHIVRYEFSLLRPDLVMRQCAQLLGVECPDEVGVPENIMTTGLMTKKAF